MLTTRRVIVSYLLTHKIHMNTYKNLCIKSKDREMLKIIMKCSGLQKKMLESQGRMKGNGRQEMVPEYLDPGGIVVTCSAVETVND